MQLVKLMLVVCVAFAAKAEDVVETTATPTSATPDDTVPASPTAVPSTSQSSPTTTPPASPSTTPSASPITTSASEPTTVPASPTTVPASPTTVPTSPTTAAPNTTTTSTTTTTTPSSAHEDPATGHWSVGNDKEKCVLAWMAVQFRIVYPTSLNASQTSYINVPENAMSQGDCAGPKEYMLLQFPTGTDPTTNQTLMSSFTLTFRENATSGSYAVDQLTAQLTVSDQLFPDHSSQMPDDLTLTVNLTSPIVMSLNKSYRCSSHQLYQLITDDADVSGQLLLTHTQLEAYRLTNTTEFSSPLVCAADHQATSDVVPIAVGVTLAILVVAILIGYVVARRRSRQGGYQSV